MNAIDKAQAEKSLAQEWFDGKRTEMQAKIKSNVIGLSWTMVDYWYGYFYARQESATKGYSI